MFSVNLAALVPSFLPLFTLAWNKNSANFAFIEFCEVHCYKLSACMMPWIIGAGQHGIGGILER
jgi:hypothetical protein